MNGTDAPMRIQMYPVAARIGNDGFDIGAGRATNDLTSWITMAPATLTLAPQTVQTVSAMFHVPAAVTAGERYGALVAETDGTQVHGSGVSVNSRVGIRVYLDVVRGTVPKSDFTISSLTPGRSHDDAPTLSAQVTNTGGRAIDVTGTLQLSNGPGGLSAGPFKVAVPETIAIHGHGNVLVQLDKALPAGPWLARMNLQSGTVRHAVQATVTFPSTPGVVAAPVKAVPLTRNRHVLVPVALALIGGLVLALILFFLWWRRRRRDDDEQSLDGAGPRLPGQRANDDVRAHR
jgi:hypothetical protein